MKGEIAIGGNKNEILPAIATACLTNQDIRLENVPHISDVKAMLDIFKSIGGVYNWDDEHTLTLNAGGLTGSRLSAESVAHIRASILFAGPLLARFGEVFIAHPGGDKIGTRQIDTHLNAFSHLGADYSVTDQGVLIKAKAGQLKPAHFMLDEQGVTPTENVLMAASLIVGETELYFAACEPHVQGLCHMLNSMGADISGIGSNKLLIKGKASLHGTTHRIGHDFMEAASFISLAAATRSELTLTNVECQYYDMTRIVLAKLGIKFECYPEQRQIHIPLQQSLTIQNYSDGKINKIFDMPWPGFAADIMSTAIVAATQSKGEIYFQDWMYDGRMYFIDSLNKMGAKIIFCDPHRIVTVGPTQLFGQRLNSPDVRAGMALLIAGLCAEGTTEIDHVSHIDRGYEKIEEKLKKIGAKIERVE